MKHCRWWSQCKTFHEYKCFEPGWPSLDCDCAGVCARAFAALHVCQHSAAAAALYLLAPAAFTPVLRVKHTHKSDTEMCRRPFWANGESCLSRRWENEPTSLQRRPQLHLGPLAGSRRLALLCGCYCTKNISKVNRLPLLLTGVGVGEGLRHMSGEVSHTKLIPIFL